MITRRLPRGHSNPHADETVPFPDCPGKARIPIVGGASVQSCKMLPPLAMDRKEWQQIGRAMEWTAETNLRDACEHALKDAESRLYMLPLNADATERAIIEAQIKIYGEALATA